MNKCCDSNALSSIVIIARRMCSSNFQQFGAPIRRNYRIRRNYKAYTFKQSQHDTRILWCQGQLKYLQSSVAFMDILPASNRHCSSIQIRDCTLVASTPLSLVWALLSSSCLHHIPPVRLLPKKGASGALLQLCFGNGCAVLKNSQGEMLRNSGLWMSCKSSHGTSRRWSKFKKLIGSGQICTTVTRSLPEQFFMHAWQNMQQQHNRNMPCRCCLKSGFLWTICMTMLCCNTYMMYCWHSEQCLQQDSILSLLSGPQTDRQAVAENRLSFFLKHTASAR